MRNLDVRSSRHYIGHMFTGLVGATGVLASRTARGPGARLSLRAHLDEEPLTLGESIAVDGVCLSVAERRPDGFEVDASAETLQRTTLGHLPIGGTVHLERSLRAGDRMGGHVVTGHVDGVGRVLDRRPVGEELWMSLQIPDGLAALVAEKGSIAVDGVSLTVNAVEADRFEILLIPITLEKTKLGTLAVGGAVNLEVDVLARYVSRWMAARG